MLAPPHFVPPYFIPCNVFAGVVVRQSDMIERIAAANPTKSVILAEDADAHAHVNSGMMIVRNDGAHHDVSVGFLRAALAS